MRSRPPLLLILFLAVLGWVGFGCNKGDQDHDHETGHHAHQPKNGGQLIEVGNHQFNLEILPDPALGRFTIWVLDAHAENYVRIPVRSLELTLQTGGAEHLLSFPAIANPASGETVGDTSQFEAAAEWLKSVRNLTGTVRGLVIRGHPFGDLPFRYPSPAETGSGH